MTQRGAARFLFSTLTTHIPTSISRSSVGSSTQCEGARRTTNSKLRPRKKEAQVPKTTYSIFFNTKLERKLMRTHDGKGANTLILSGLHTDCCVRHTTADTFFKGYEAIIAKDDVESSTELQYQTGLQYLKFWCLADMLPTKKIVKLS